VQNYKSIQIKKSKNVYIELNISVLQIVFKN